MVFELTGLLALALLVGVTTAMLLANCSKSRK